jgi:toxin HigB-1
MRMIRSFRHKGLARLFNDGDRRGVRPDMARRLERRLAALHKAKRLEDVDLPGWRLHRLRGDDAGRWAIDVNGPWRITVAWEEDGHVVEVDLEQYH